MDLRALQARFHALVTAPEGVTRTLAARGQTPADVEALVVGDARLSAVDRLDIYANMYFFRLLDVLRDDYAKVVGAAGDAAFHNLVTDYLAACPPAHASIARAGARLPAFLADHALGQERPWLAPLAALERSYAELFDGPDAEPLTLDEIQGMSPDSLMELVLAPIPCHRILSHGFAVDELWRALEAGPPGEIAVRPETLLVWRPQLEVHHRPLDDEEAWLLSLLDGRSTLGAVCERMPGAVDEAARRLFQTLGRWLADRLLTRA